MKALITYKHTEEEINKLKKLGYQLVYKNEKDISLTEEIKDIDVMVCFNPFEKIDIDDFPNLKWIQLGSAGINQVPEDKVLNRDIIVTNNRGGFSIPIAEWIVLRVLEMVKNTKEFHSLQASKTWKTDNSMLELHGKTVGFIGTGSIAQEAAKRLDSFGVNLLGFNFTGNEAKYFHQSFNINEIKAYIDKCDFLIVAAPYTEATHHLVNEDLFQSMKDGTYLVNIARGSIIDENALIKHLKSGKIRKAALDVFEVEPLPESSPLWEMEQVLISPHNSWGSEMIFQRRFELVYKNMMNYINNKELFNVIDFKRGY